MRPWRLSTYITTTSSFSIGELVISTTKDIRFLFKKWVDLGAWWLEIGRLEVFDRLEVNRLFEFVFVCKTTDLCWLNTGFYTTGEQEVGNLGISVNTRKKDPSWLLACCDKFIHVICNRYSPARWENKFIKKGVWREGGGGVRYKSNEATSILNYTSTCIIH